MNKGKTLLASASVALAALIALPTVSAAAETHVSGSACSARDPHQLDGSHDVGASGWSVTNDTLELVCPIETTDSDRFQDIDHIYVHMFDGSAVGGNYARTRVCARDPFAVTQDCSAETSAGGYGYQTHDLNVFDELHDVNGLSFEDSEDRTDWYFTLRVNLFSNRSVEQALLGYTIVDY